MLTPSTLAPLTAAVPALLRLPAAGRPAGTSVGFVGIAEDKTVCVELAPGDRARVSAAAVGILPFTAPTLASPAATALVLEAEGAKVQVDRGGVFQPEPDLLVLAPEALDLRVPAAPLVLGDLPLAALVLGRTPSGDLAAEVRTPVAVRGLLLPPGAEIQVAGDRNSVLSNVVLRKTAKIGGLSGKVGDRLELVNGCDFAYTPAGSSGVEQTQCYDVRDGVLVAPG